MHWLLLFCSLFSATAQESRATLLADQLTAQGNYAEAEAAYSELLQSRPGEPDILLKRGSVRMVLGRYTEARTDLEAAVAGQQQPAALALAHAQLGLFEQIQGRNTQAIRHDLMALQLNQEFYGPRHPTVGVTWSRLGEVYLASGSIAKAVEALANAIAILKASPGYEFHLCVAHTDEANVFLEQHRYLEAGRSLEQAIRSNTRENACTPILAIRLGQLDYAQKDYSRAEASFRDAIDVGRRIWPSDNPAVAGAFHGLAQTAAARHQLAQARELFQQSLEMYERMLGPTHPDIRDVLLDLAALLRTAHRGREARVIAGRIRRDFPASVHTVSANALAGR